MRDREGGSEGCGDDGRDWRERSIVPCACGCSWTAATSSWSTGAAGCVCDVGETEAEWGGGGGEKGLAGMVGVLIVSGGGRCWGDTKGLAGVTKGMVVSTKRTVVSALVSGAGTRTHRHGNPAVFLLDGHRWERAVEGTRGRRVHGGGSGSVSALTARCAALARRRHVGVQRGELRHHLLILFCLVGVDGLCVLSEVVQSRELLATVASKRPLAGVLSVIE